MTIKSGSHIQYKWGWDAAPAYNASFNYWTTGERSTGCSETCGICLWSSGLISHWLKIQRRHQIIFWLYFDLPLDWRCVWCCRLQNTLNVACGEASYACCYWIVYLDNKICRQGVTNDDGWLQCVKTKLQFEAEFLLFYSGKLHSWRRTLRI